MELEWMKLEDHMFSQNIRFYNLNLNHEDMGRDKDGAKLITLSSLYEEMKALHGEEIIDYLKIDMAGKEWKVSTKFDYSKKNVAIIFPFCF